MKHYDSYKDSGIEWIGEIPIHWILSRIGRHFFMERGRVISKEEISDNLGEYPVYSSQTENYGVLGSINTFDFEGEYVTWTTDGANAGTCFYRTGKFNTTNVCGLLSYRVSGRNNLKFLNYLLNLGTKGYVRVDINPKLMNNMMGDIPFISPPLSEQEHIVSYLDDKTTKIDELIQKKLRKIDFLKEYRTSIINTVVTKGLNSNVPMKDSGIEWIGEIPSHWEISKVKYVLEFHNNQRVPLSSEERENRKGQYRYYGSTGVIDYVDDFIYDGEYILIGEDGSNLKLRNYRLSNLVNGKFWVNNHSHILKTINGSNLYFSHILEITDYTEYITGSTQPKLTMENLSIIPVINPPLSEQEQIVTYLDEKTSQIDKTIDIEKKKIELLKEYRQSLISNVVTGKINISRSV
jgi:type I restriction enzyme S subunit